uniref:Uncharacterized protein n=1 Tax=Meloidogyne javanica TaxID=6303 RepID=A0A915M297_MELJA
MSENFNNYQVNEVGQRANEELEAFAMQVDDDPLKLLEDRVEVIEKTPFVAEVLNEKESEEGVGDEVEME